MSRELELAISDSTTILKVSTMLNNTDFPIPGIILIGAEKIKYNNLTDREFIECTRGYLGTTAIAHAKGSDVTYFSSIPTIPTSVTSIHADSESNIIGDVQLVSGNGITLSQMGQEITIDSTGSPSIPDPLILPGNLSMNENSLISVNGGTTATFGYDWELSINGNADSNYSGIVHNASGDKTTAQNTIEIYQGGYDIGNSTVLGLSASNYGYCDINAYGIPDSDAPGDTQYLTINSDFGSGSKIRLNIQGSQAMELDRSTITGDTRLMLWDVSAGTMVRVTRGAADSGGTGYRVLRIPN
jgi:hypothetical protein